MAKTAQSDPRIQIQVAPGSDPYVLRVRGELDLAGCPELELSLQDAESSRARRITLELDELVFVDAAGLRVLATAATRSAENGDRLRINGGAGQLARLLRATGLDANWPGELRP